VPTSRPYGSGAILANWTVDELIERGRSIGVPEITWGLERDTGVFVTFHFAHGDSTFYPIEEKRIMVYSPQPGDIGLVRMPGAGGRAIRIGQWLAGDGYSDYEHVMVLVGSVEDRGVAMVMEAMPGGARLTLLSYYTRQGEVLWLRCPPEHRTAVAAAALALEGTPYSWADYWAVGAHRLHIPAPHLERYIVSSKHLMCAQLADRAADAGGWHLFTDGRWVGDVTPGDLARLARKQPVAG
jgi:hypothetical protein